MAAIWQNISTGAWLTPSRMRGYSAVLLAAYLIASVLWIALANGLVDRNNQPLGTDFSNVYAAGMLASNGKPDVAYDWPSEHAVEKAIFGRDVPFYGWHYPPQFLLVAAILALVPYGWALRCGWPQRYQLTSRLSGSSYRSQLLFWSRSPIQRFSSISCTARMVLSIPRCSAGHCSCSTAVQSRQAF